MRFGSGDREDAPCTGLLERPRGLKERRTRRCDVVNEDDGCAADAFCAAYGKTSADICFPFRERFCFALRFRMTRAHKACAGDHEAEGCGKAFCDERGLVEAAAPEARRGKWDGDHGCTSETFHERLGICYEQCRKRLGGARDTPELEPMDECPQCRRFVIAGGTQKEGMHWMAGAFGNRVGGSAAAGGAGMGRERGIALATEQSAGKCDRRAASVA